MGGGGGGAGWNKDVLDGKNRKINNRGDDYSGLDSINLRRCLFGKRKCKPSGIGTYLS